MKNKKAQDDFLVIVFIIVLVIVLFFILFEALSGEPSDLKNYLKDDPEQQCKDKCKEYNAAFVQYEEGSFRKNDECWCKRGKEPLRIW